MASTADLVTESVADLTKKDNGRSFRDMNFSEKLSYIREVITVEPLICAYVMASVLCAPALLNLEFEKSCRSNLNLNDTVCEAILYLEEHNFTDTNTDIQILISDMHSWQQPLQSVMPLILVLFLGSYSDRHKWRKPFLLIPLIGELFSVVGCILCVVFMKEWPLEAQGVSQTVIPSFFGGQTMVVMAVFAYIADVSTVEMRTLRVGVVQIAMNICYPLVQSFSGILYDKIGYYGVLIIAAGFYLFGIIYGLFWIKEPKQPIRNTKKCLLFDIFDPRDAIDTLKLPFMNNPGNNRVYIWLVLFILFIYSGVVVGETSLFYLYVQGQFQWNVVDYSYFSTVNTLVHLVGTIVAIPLFTKVLNLTDPTILFLTFLDKIICNVVFGLANSTTLLYVAAVVSIITGVTAVAIRSLSSKIVSLDDLGKAQSLFGICEAIAPAVAIPIYNKGIYKHTITDFPPAFLFFGLILYAACCPIILWMYIDGKRKSRQMAQQEKANGTHEKPLPMETYTQTTHI